MSEVDDTKTCPVCYETFDMERTVPRLLPCTHTLCEICLDEARGKKKFLVCPVCRKKHLAQNGINSFSQNRYIVSNLQEKTEPFKFPQCPDHDRELSLHCKSLGCQRDICQICDLESHRSHEVVDIVQEENNKAKRRIQPVALKTEKCKESLLEIKHQVQNSCDESISKLEKIKSLCVQAFDAEINKVKTCMKSGVEEIDKQLEVIKVEMEKLSDVRNKVQLGTKDASIRSRAKAVDDVELVIGSLRDKTKLYTYYECEDKEICDRDVKLLLPRLKARTTSSIAQRPDKISTPGNPKSLAPRVEHQAASEPSASSQKPLQNKVQETTKQKEQQMLKLLSQKRPPVNTPESTTQIKVAKKTEPMLQKTPQIKVPEPTPQTSQQNKPPEPTPQKPPQIKPTEPTPQKPPQIRPTEPTSQKPPQNKPPEPTPQKPPQNKLPEPTLQKPPQNKPPEPTPQKPPQNKLPEPTLQEPPQNKPPEPTLQKPPQNKLPESTLQELQQDKPPEPTPQKLQQNKAPELTPQIKVPGPTPQKPQQNKPPEPTPQMSQQNKLPESTLQELQQNKPAEPTPQMSQQIRLTPQTTALIKMTKRADSTPQKLLQIKTIEPTPQKQPGSKASEPPTWKRMSSDTKLQDSGPLGGKLASRGAEIPRSEQSASEKSKSQAEPQKAKRSSINPARLPDCKKPEKRKAECCPPPECKRSKPEVSSAGVSEPRGLQGLFALMFRSAMQNAKSRKEATQSLPESKKQLGSSTPAPVIPLQSDRASVSSRLVQDSTRRRIFITESITCIRVLWDGNIIVFQTGKHNRLTKYDVSGKTLANALINTFAEDLVEVELGDKRCIAVSCGFDCEIQFRNLETLEKMCSYTLGPSYSPTRLCSPGKNTLLYKNFFKLEFSFRILDCSDAFPRPADGTNVVAFKMYGVANFKDEKLWDWCCVFSGDIKLVVMATKSGKLAAFNMETGECKWKASAEVPSCKNPMKAMGVASDGNGRFIFVRDGKNKCVHLFSAAGKFVRTVLKSEELGCGSIKRVRFDTKTSSLVVAYREKEQYSIAIVKIRV